MSKLKCWVIVHRPTGRVIPVAKGHNGRGGSCVEPADPHMQWPRLFKTERSAKGWLTTWLKGKQREVQYQDYAGYVASRIEVELVPSRLRDEMEIISASLVI